MARKQSGEHMAGPEDIGEQKKDDGRGLVATSTEKCGNLVEYCSISVMSRRKK
jgi:hypothetical protein